MTERNGAWGKPEEVPGTQALNVGGEAAVDSLSCASAGNCAAAGSYVDNSRHGQLFVAVQKKGTWGKAREVPGMAALNIGGAPQIYSMSCGSPGNCAVGGRYRQSSGRYQAWLVTEVNGIWGAARQVPGTAQLNARGDASIESVSCRTSGRCSAGGYYADSADHIQAFVVTRS